MTKLPRESEPRKYGNKESRPFPVWNGILEHRLAIGPALWEFLWCLDKITVERDGVGWCLGRAPIKVERIAEELKEHYNTAKDNLKRLDDLGYITRIRTPYGYVIGVRNSRKFGIWKVKRDREKTVTLNEQQTDRKSPISQEETDRKSAERVGENCLRDSGKTVETKKTQQETQQETQQDRFVDVVEAEEDSHLSINHAAASSTDGQMERAPAPAFRKRIREMPTNLRVWMQGRILARATGTVRSKHAYLQTAQTVFLENLQVEIEEFLVEQAAEFLKGRFSKDPGAVVAWNDVFQHLAIQAQHHGLPVDRKVFEVCTRAASQMLGCVDKPTPERVH